MSDVIQHNGQPYELVRVDDKTVVAKPLPAHAPVHEAVSAAIEKIQAEIPARRKPGRPRKSA